MLAYLYDNKCRLKSRNTTKTTKADNIKNQMDHCENSGKKKSSQITFCCKRGDFDYIIFVSPLVIDHN